MRDDQVFSLVSYVGLFCGVVGLVGGLLLGSAIESTQYQREAIKHRAAHYHPDTGVFTWNSPSETTP